MLQCPILILLLLQLSSQQNQLEASLDIISFVPPLFNLTFSAPVSIPSFQLLFNSIPINYTVISNSSEQLAFYLIEGDTQNIVNIADFSIEKYTVSFVEPLLIDNGNLNLNSYTLKAQNVDQFKQGIIHPLANQGIRYSYQNQGSSMPNLVIVIISLAYFLAFTTVIGLSCFHFLSIYTFYSLHYEYFTAFDYEMGYYFLFQIRHPNNQQYATFIYIWIPIIIMALSFLVSVTVRFCLKNLTKSTIFWSEVYYFFSHRLFIICSEIMILPILSNVIHLIQSLIQKSQILDVLTIAYIYFGIVMIGLFLYFSYLVINPQINETEHQWKTYTSTSHFKMFEGLHPNIETESWLKRNYYFLRNLERVFIVVFLSLTFFQVFNLLFQTAHLIYLFMIRPFKYDFFNYSLGIVQIIILFFYLSNYIFYLYDGISDEIITSTDVTKFLLTCIIFVSFIAFTFFILAFYELAFRIRAFQIILKSKKREKRLNSRRRQSISKKDKSLFQEEIQTKKRSQKQFEISEKNIGSSQSERPHPKRRARKLKMESEQQKVTATLKNKKVKKSLLQNIANQG